MWNKLTNHLYDFEYKPDFINLGRSVYGTNGPTYKVKRSYIKPMWEVIMYLGNCGWKISDKLFDSELQAKEFCERHSHENFRGVI